MKTVDGAGLEARLGELFQAVPNVVAAGNVATPWTLVEHVDRALPAYRLFALNGQRGLPEREGVVHVTPFVGPGQRCSARLEYVPARLSLVPQLFMTTYVPDLVLLHTTPPRAGVVSLGVEVNVLPAAIDAARAHGALVVAQVNPRMPWTGGDALVRTELIDLAVEVDQDVVAPVASEPSSQARAIGDRVAALVAWGATLQVGIGAVPDSVLAALRGHRGLRIWSEMLSDGVLGLERSGALDREEPVVASFLFGSEELYDWVDRNPRVLMRRTEITNDPARIAAQPVMTALNGALEVDLYGQANASWVRDRIHSGFGGQSDFVSGALHSRGGTAIIALPSWHQRADCSTIVPLLQGPVTSFQHSFVVTEQGSAAVWPCSAEDQAANLVRVAHPDARAGLERSLLCR